MIRSDFFKTHSQSIHIREFITKNASNSVLLLHGSLEDGRVFYSKSEKGLAPYLQNRAYNVYVPDLQGRGKSSPQPKYLDKGHDDILLEDIPNLIDFVFKKEGKPIIIMCHSWGGVLLLAALARKPELQAKINAMVFFGTKRYISITSLRKFWFVNILWSGLGTLLTRIYGYLPAKQLKIGAADETKDTFMGTKMLVFNKKWTGKDGFDYASHLKTIDKPPAIFLAGVKDYYLGHPTDVKRLMDESGYEKAELRILGKINGASHDYGHIDMLTSPKAKADIFEPLILWLQGI